MKAFINKSILLASAVIALAACSKEQSVQIEGNSGSYIFSVAVPSAKTTLGEKGLENEYPNLWTTGDKLNVNGIESDPLDEKYNALSSADFTVNGEISSPYLAVYPSGAVSSCNTQDKTALIVIPATQIYEAGTYDPEAYIMAASSDSKTLSLESVMAILKITPTGTSGAIKSITVKSLGGKQLSGEFAYNFTDKILSSAAEDSTVTVSGPANGVALGNPWLICLPSGDYTDGLEISMIDTKGNRMVKTATPAKTYASGVMYATEIPYVSNYYTITCQADIDAISLEGEKRIEAVSLICKGAGVDNTVWANIKNKISKVRDLYCEDCSFTMCGNFFKGTASNTNGVEVTGSISFKNICTSAGQYLNSDNIPTSVGGNMTIENVRIHGWAGAGFNTITEIAGDLVIKTNLMGNNAAFVLLKKVGGNMTVDGVAVDFNGSRVWNLDQWTIETIGGKLALQNTSFVNFQGFEKIKSIGSIYIKNNPIPTATFSTVQTWINTGVVLKEAVECYDENGNPVTFQSKPDPGSEYPDYATIVKGHDAIVAFAKNSRQDYRYLVIDGNNETVSNTEMANLKLAVKGVTERLIFKDIKGWTMVEQIILAGDFSVEPTGSLEIINCPDIDNINGLKRLTKVEGDLILKGLPKAALNWGAGNCLNNITEVTGNFTLDNAGTALTGATCLASLAKVGGNFTVTNMNLGFWNLDGMPLTEIGGDFIYKDNALVNSFNGFTGLTKIGGCLKVSGTAITDFSQVQTWINDGVVAYDKVECHKADGSLVSFTAPK